jgi:anti-sigma regulatory factor (Ser/Thr protein kinase)
MSQPKNDLFRRGLDPDRSIWLLLPSRLELLGVVDGLVQGILNHLDADEETAIAVATSVIEAGTNAIQHGHKLDAAKSVRFCFRFQAGTFEVWVTDAGAGFDLDSIQVSDPTRPEDLLKARGRGIFIMRSMMDSVEFDIRRGVGTTVHLTKNWKANGLPPDGVR